MIPLYTDWQATTHRYTPPAPELQQTVAQIIGDVRQNGDVALAQWAAHWGDAPPSLLSPAEINNRIAHLSDADKTHLKAAANAITQFGQHIMHALQPAVASVHPDGRTLMGARFKPVDTVGCYVPGGRYALPSSALMTAITAQVAGVKRRIVVSPKLHPATCYAGQLAGVDTFIEMGGAQALAAMAFGTATIPKVDMVVGPGNAAVVEAKRQLLGVIGIDMLAGPSEVVTIADAHANPDWVAVDLLAQAEHDPDARAFLLTDSHALAFAVQGKLAEWHQKLALPAFLLSSLQHSGLYVLPTLVDCAKAANTLAPEHLQVMTLDPHALTPYLNDYGALFLGYHTSVPFGDYAAGPNHTLPTARSARFSGALSPLTFLRTQTWLHVSPGNGPLNATCQHLATIEGLSAHAHSVSLRSE
jgi:sulfopropanediol 3-dehydrogenase